MAPLGILVSPKDSGSLFDDFDEDGSGSIEYHELNRMVCKLALHVTSPSPSPYPRPLTSSNTSVTVFPSPLVRACAATAAHGSPRPARARLARARPLTIAPDRLILPGALAEHTGGVRLAERAHRRVNRAGESISTASMLHLPSLSLHVPLNRAPSAPSSRQLAPPSRDSTRAATMISISHRPRVALLVVSHPMRQVRCFHPTRGGGRACGWTWRR